MSVHLGVTENEIPPFDGGFLFELFLKIPLTKSILRDMMYYGRRGMIWIFN